MRPELYTTYEVRIKNFIHRLESKMILPESIPLTAVFNHSKEPVRFTDRLSREYKPIIKGEKWGSAWDSAWFHLTGDVPIEWCGKKIVANLDFNGESLVFDNDGCPLYGLTNGSVFAVNYGKDVYHLFDSCEGGEKVDLWIEAAANGLFGINVTKDPERDCPKRFGEYEGKVNSMTLAIFDENIFQFMLDIKQLFSIFKGKMHVGEKHDKPHERLPKLPTRAKRILYILNKAIDVFADNPQNVVKAHDIIKPLYNTSADSSAISINAIGHAHIDTGWLWPVRESIRKSARTFSSQIDLLNKYPEYIFGASQPQHYQFIKDNYPRLYEKIKKAVKDGRWECQGGMWVEADCNIISGESMVRQFMHGKNFFMDEFGVDVHNLWIPDVFGYSAAMPQIMKKCGVEYFLTQKISWSQYNQFPHNTFIWRGIDGSEVITHFPPEDTYNSTGEAEGQIKAENNFKEGYMLDEAMCLLGIGNGGGGPKEEHVENIRRLKNIEGSPKVKFSTAESFFNRLEKHRNDLEVWDGELYLELHRATLTTQAKTKKVNRLLERKLREVEFLYSMLSISMYPQGALDRLWKVLLINQFHDILPGSSINLVYNTTEKEYTQSITECNALIQKASEYLLDNNSDKLNIINILSVDYTAQINFPDSWRGYGAVDSYGNIVPVQEDENGVVALIKIPSLSAIEISKSAKAKTNQTNGLVLENELIRYEFAEDGTIVSAVDKETGSEIIEQGQKGNLLSLYADRPNSFDAWDIDITYENAIMDNARVGSVTPLSEGDVRKGIKFTLFIGENSEIKQSVYLNAGSKRLDFHTKVKWQEFHKMLRVSFPVNITNNEASYDVQYGYVKRPTHRNTSWDMAKFEVVGHKYADLSNADYGVALLNDCKYGYKIHNNVIDLNLLRSSTYPDADADLGTQTFTYSLLPHTDGLTKSNVMSEAQMLNFHPLVLEGSKKIFHFRYQSKVMEYHWKY